MTAAEATRCVRQTLRSPSFSRATLRVTTSSVPSGFRAIAAVQSAMAPCAMHETLSREEGVDKVEHASAPWHVALAQGSSFQRC